MVSLMVGIWLDGWVVDGSVEKVGYSRIVRVDFNFGIASNTSVCHVGTWSSRDRARSIADYVMSQIGVSNSEG